jgi:D-galactarolactone cycloisomerase
VKITDVELIQLAKTLDHPHRNSKQTMIRRVFSLIRLTTDDGVDGLGEASCDPAVVSGLLARLRRVFIGMDPFNVEELWQRAFHGAAMYDPKGAAVAVISGVDIACWDIMGKALGVPAHKLLGGQSRRAIPAYASDLHWLEDPDEMARLAARHVERGFAAVKTHLGVDPEGDHVRVCAIRNAIGDDVRLMVDINTAFDRPTAIRFGRRIAPYDITWYEEPLSPMDLDGLPVVRTATGLPIAGGENEYTRWGFKEQFSREALDVAMPDVARAGGITELKKIFAVADAFGVAVSPHNYSSGVCSAATLHLMAAFAATGPLEWDVTNASILDELFLEPLSVRGGQIEVPESPGLGVHVPDAVRAQYEFREG